MELISVYVELKDFVKFLYLSKKINRKLSSSQQYKDRLIEYLSKFFKIKLSKSTYQNFVLSKTSISLPDELSILNHFTCPNNYILNPYGAFLFEGWEKRGNEENWLISTESHYHNYETSFVASYQWCELEFSTGISFPGPSPGSSSGPSSGSSSGPSPGSNSKSSSAQSSRSSSAQSPGSSSGSSSGPSSGPSSRPSSGSSSGSISGSNPGSSSISSSVPIRKGLIAGSPVSRHDSCPAKAKVSIRVINQDSNLNRRKESMLILAHDEKDPSMEEFPWQLLSVSIELIPGDTSAIVIFGGMDENYWKDNYGPRFGYCYLREFTL